MNYQFNSCIRNWRQEIYALLAGIGVLDAQRSEQKKNPKIRPGQHRSHIFEKRFANSSNIKYCFHQCYMEVLYTASTAADL